MTIASGKHSRKTRSRGKLGGLAIVAMAIALAMSAMAGAFAAGHTGITSPTEGEIVITNVLELRAYEPGADADGVAAWAVRSADNNPDCGTSQPDLAGWQGPHADAASWDGTYFEADIEVSGWDRGEYCFAFNPEPFYENRHIVFFSLGTPESKDACKDGGWQTFGDWKNQGECVSYFARMQRDSK